MTERDKLKDVAGEVDELVYEAVAVLERLSDLVVDIDDDGIDEIHIQAQAALKATVSLQEAIGEWVAVLFPEDEPAPASP
jgi:hypothetical protein